MLKSLSALDVCHLEQRSMQFSGSRSKDIDQQHELTSKIFLCGQGIICSCEIVIHVFRKIAPGLFDKLTTIGVIIAAVELRNEKAFRKPYLHSSATRILDPAN